MNKFDKFHSHLFVKYTIISSPVSHCKDFNHCFIQMNYCPSYNNEPALKPSQLSGNVR